MAGNFRLVYPRQGRMQFDGGLNKKFERSIISDNESPDCKNVRFSNGAVETRRGSVIFNTQAIGSFAGDYLGVRHDDTGAETMIAGAGGSFWYASNTTFVTIPSSQSLFTAGVKFGSAEYENALFLGNGGQIAYKYNGTEFTRHGIYPPTNTPTVTSNAIGTLTGDYRYKISNVNTALVESDVGPASVTFTAASATLRVTLQTFAVSYGVAARKIYRTEAGGTTFKLLTTVSDHTTTTYDDNTLDSSLGATAPTDNGVPPLYSVIKQHQNRMWCNDTANPNYVWYSEANDPYTFPSTNFIKIGDGTSDLVQGISTYGNNILVLCSKSLWLIYLGDPDPANWVVTKIQTPFGCKSPHGVFEFNNKLMYPALQNDRFVGFAVLSGIGVQPSTTFLTTETAGSLLESDRIEPDMFEVQKAQAGNIYALVFDNVAYISVTHGAGNSANNRIWVYNFSIDNLSKNQQASWSPDTGINANQMVIYADKMYFISSSANGQVYQYEVEDTYSDNGVAIDSYYWTKEISVSGENTTFNDFRYVKMLVDQAGDFDMNLYYRVDSDKDDGDVVRVNLDPGGSLWGTMVWGTDFWGGGSDQDDKTVSLGNKRGERIQFRFDNQNTVDQRFKVHGMKFYFNRKGFR